MTEFFDSHAHLQEPEFGQDLGSVMERARAAGVSRVVVPAVDLETGQSAIGLARRFEGVYATAGYHPHEASRFDAGALAGVDGLLDDPNAVAVGEIGLDFFRMHSPVQAQTDAFAAQLSLAGRRTLPVVVHCRDAWAALAEQLTPWARKVAGRFNGRPVGVLHYFSGGLEEASRYLELGFLISVHTSVTHPRASLMRDVVANVPLDSLLIETDSPYGAPQARRGRRNEPAYVVEAAKAVAEVRGITVDAVAETTTANALRLFALPSPAAAGPAESRG